MAAAVIKGALARVPAVKPEMVEDVVLGCAMPEAEQGMQRGAHGQPARRRAPRPRAP